MDPQLHALLRQALAPLKQQIDLLKSQVDALTNKPMTWEQYLDCIPGRRVAYNYVAVQDFTAQNVSQRGAAMNYQISIDGPFIMTHYPIAVWKPSLPANATNLGRWRPVNSFPLPTQQLGSDFIDISWELTDTGPTRNMQNDAVSGPTLSYPGNLCPLPVRTKYEGNSTIAFTPTYEAINFFDGGEDEGVATTGGKLVVVLPGIKIITALGNG